AVFDPRGGQWMGKKYVPSLLAAIGEVIETHMIDIGLIPNPREAREGQRELKIVGGSEVLAAGAGAAPEGVRLRGCPKCGERSLIRQEDCDICTSCGHSKCG
ncbi:MAG: ribonucleoside-diphosphate reductase, adenosylcobalamin-dependent, partial [Bauldia litoralis]